MHYSQGVHLFRKFRINIFSQVLCITSYRVYLLRNFHIKSHSTCLVHFPNTKYIYYEIFQLNQLEVYVLYMIPSVFIYFEIFMTILSAKSCALHTKSLVHCTKCMCVYYEKIATNPITQSLSIIPSLLFVYLYWKNRNKSHHTSLVYYT